MFSCAPICVHVDIEVGLQMKKSLGPTIALVQTPNCDHTHVKCKVSNEYGHSPNFA